MMMKVLGAMNIKHDRDPQHYGVLLPFVLPMFYYHNIHNKQWWGFSSYYIYIWAENIWYVLQQIVIYTPYTCFLGTWLYVGMIIFSM